MATLSVRMDEYTKNSFSNFCNEIGMSISTAFNIFAKKVVRDQKFPFELSISDEISNKETIAALEESEALLKNPNVKKYNTAEELMEDILS